MDDKAQQLELVLHRLDALPTLGPIAVRVLDLTARAETETDEIVTLIASDPALASRVVKLARATERGRFANVNTVDRAVKLIGFQAVRCAVLGVQIFDLMERASASEVDATVFDRAAFWRHSLGVAVLAQWLARESGGDRGVQAEAFLGGLIHDLGLLALSLVMPEPLDEACRLAETGVIGFDAACERLLGLDPARAGKHLAEQWNLPPDLVEVIWLHGQPAPALLAMEPNDMLVAVALSDAVVRRQHLAPPGHGPRLIDEGALRSRLGLDVAAIDTLLPHVHRTVSERAEALGLDTPPEQELMLQSITRANEALCHMNLALRHQVASNQRDRATLQACATFLSEVAGSATPNGVLGAVARSLHAAAGGGRFIGIRQQAAPGRDQVVVMAPDGAVHDVTLAPTVESAQAPDGRSTLDVLRYEPVRAMFDVAERPHVLLVHRSDAGTTWLAHDASIDGHDAGGRVRMLRRVWQAAMGGAEAQATARQRHELLARANDAIARHEEQRVRTRTLATLGEVAAGAAHEMNNPLTVISGRAQLLARRLDEPASREMAEQIIDEAHRLADMIAAFRAVAEPVTSVIEPVSIPALLREIVSDLPGTGIAIDLDLAPDVPEIEGDQYQIRTALRQIILNALESPGCTRIIVRVQRAGIDDRLSLAVEDDGAGLSEHAMTHAFDPFFSDKPAGRQPGLGLPIAQRFVQANGGRISLENRTDGGARALVSLRIRRPAARPVLDAVRGGRGIDGA
ncbi:MAG: HDOD domain-containing protein [Phycisphaerales bacterium]|nr:HDOD domain-containing protein [Phycisphaerales bacterium]